METQLEEFQFITLGSIDTGNTTYMIPLFSFSGRSTMTIGIIGGILEDVSPKKK